MGDDVESREVVFQDLLGFCVELFSGQVQQQKLEGYLSVGGEAGFDEEGVQGGAFGDLVLGGEGLEERTASFRVGFEACFWIDA